MLNNPIILGTKLPTLTNPGAAGDLLAGKQLIDQNGNVLTGTMSTLAQQTQGTATAAQILSGQTAWVNGSKITGSMVNRGTISQSLNAGGTYTIPAGYHNGSGRVTANSLSSQTSGTATAADIAKGKTAWVNGSKITGTHTESSGELTSAPLYADLMVETNVVTLNYNTLKIAVPTTYWSSGDGLTHNIDLKKILAICFGSAVNNRCASDPETQGTSWWITIAHINPFHTYGYYIVNSAEKGITETGGLTTASARLSKDLSGTGLSMSRSNRTLTYTSSSSKFLPHYSHQVTMLYTE